MQKKKSNQIQNIINDINKKLVDKHKRPDSEKLESISINDDFEYSYLSEHKRDNGLSNIFLYHLMFDVNSKGLN